MTAWRAVQAHVAIWILVRAGVRPAQTYLRRNLCSAGDRMAGHPAAPSVYEPTLSSSCDSWSLLANIARSAGRQSGGTAASTEGRAWQWTFRKAATSHLCRAAAKSSKVQGADCQSLDWRCTILEPKTRRKTWQTRQGVRL